MSRNKDLKPLVSDTRPANGAIHRPFDPATDRLEGQAGLDELTASGDGTNVTTVDIDGVGGDTQAGADIIGAKPLTINSYPGSVVHSSKRLSGQLTELDQEIDAARDDIGRLKTALLKRVVTINPSFAIDDNGLLPGSDSNYCDRVTYDILLKDGATPAAQHIIADSALATGIAGVSILPVHPFYLILRLDEVPSQYKPASGNISEIEIVNLRAFDSQGNYAELAITKLL